MDWPVNPALEAFEYERGEGRHKHRWKHNYAGFVPSKRGPVGKCHKSISDTIAQGLLRSGFPEVSPYDDDEDDEDPPEEIFNLYRGVPYLAVPTRPGISYHGYPWCGRMSGTMKGWLRARAEEEGSLKDFERWLEKHARR